jgi:hypothetical protein
MIRRATPTLLSIASSSSFSLVYIFVYVFVFFPTANSKLVKAGNPHSDYSLKIQVNQRNEFEM